MPWRAGWSGDRAADDSPPDADRGRPVFAVELLADQGQRGGEHAGAQLMLGICDFRAHQQPVGIGIDRRRDGRRVLYKVVDPHIVTLVHQGVEHILDQRPRTGNGPDTVTLVR